MSSMRHHAPAQLAETRQPTRPTSSEAGAAIDQAPAMRGNPGGFLLQLQRTYGNRYVQGLLRPSAPALGTRSPGPAPVIQPKLILGAPGDRFEREADRIAKRMTGRLKPGNATAAETTQRLSATGGASAGPVDIGIQQAILSARGGGYPLPGNMRAPMEEALSADLSGVRLHTNPRADALNQLLRARAFTAGQDIFFRRGAYDPTGHRGRELISHELTHVAQQSSDRAHVSARTAPPTAIQRVYMIETAGGLLDVDKMTANQLRALLAEEKLTDDDHEYVLLRLLLLAEHSEPPEPPHPSSEPQILVSPPPPPESVRTDILSTASLSRNRPRIRKKTNKPLPMRSRSTGSISTKKAIKPTGQRSKEPSTGKKVIKRPKASVGKAIKHPKAPIEKVDDAKLAGMFITDLEERLRILTQIEGTGEFKLHAAFEIDIMPIAIDDPHLLQALQNLNDAVKLVVESTFAHKEDLLQLPTKEEKDIEQEYSDLSELHGRLLEKRTYHREKMQESRTALGQAYHRTRGMKYKARQDKLQTTTELYPEAEKSAIQYRSRKLKPVHDLARPLDIALKAIADLVGGKRALGLLEGVNPSETMKIIIQMYQAQLMGL